MGNIDFDETMNVYRERFEFQKEAEKRGYIKKPLNPLVSQISKVKSDLTFKDQYHHPEWQKVRLKVMDYDNWQCQRCGEKDNILHVHHIRYKKDRMVWEYPIHNFITLCDKCHEKEHEHKNLVGTCDICRSRKAKFLSAVGSYASHKWKFVCVECTEIDSVDEYGEVGVISNTIYDIPLYNDDAFVFDTNRWYFHLLEKNWFNEDQFIDNLDTFRKREW